MAEIKTGHQRNGKDDITGFFGLELLSICWYLQKITARDDSWFLYQITRICVNLWYQLSESLTFHVGCRQPASKAPLVVGQFDVAG